MFTNWDDSLDINFITSLDSNDYLEDTHSPFYLERAIMNFHDDNVYNDLYESSKDVKKENSHIKEDPILNEEWFRLRKIIQHENLWPHIDDLLITIPEWAVCNVCSELFKHPLKWIQCEHNICKDCMLNLIKYGHFECPVCLCKLPENFDTQLLVRDDNLIRRIGNLKARCRWSLKLNKVRKKKEKTLTGSLGTYSNIDSYPSPTIQSFEEYMIHYSARSWVTSDEGCNEIVCLSQLVRHHLECKHRPVSCKYKECNIYVPYYKLDEHMKDCIYQIVQCKNCKNDYALKDKEYHIQICPNEIIQCTLCSSTLQRKYMDQHVQTECPAKIIPCPHNKYGCKYECSRDKMKNHLSNCTFETMKDFILSVTRRLDEYEKIIRSQKEKILRLEWTIESQNMDNDNGEHRHLSGLESPYTYDDYF